MKSKRSSLAANKAEPINQRCVLYSHYNYKVVSDVYG